MDIKRRRIEAGLTQNELAELLGKNRVTVSNWETGKVAPSIKALREIAELFGCSIADLFAEGAPAQTKGGGSG